MSDRRLRSMRVGIDGIFRPVLSSFELGVEVERGEFAPEDREALERSLDEVCCRVSAWNRWRGPRNLGVFGASLCPLVWASSAPRTMGLFVSAVWMAFSLAPAHRYERRIFVFVGAALACASAVAEPSSGLRTAVVISSQFACFAAMMSAHRFGAAEHQIGPFATRLNAERRTTTWVRLRGGLHPGAPRETIVAWPAGVVLRRDGDAVTDWQLTSTVGSPWEWAARHRAASTFVLREERELSDDERSMLPAFANVVAPKLESREWIVIFVVAVTALGLTLLPGCDGPAWVRSFFACVGPALLGLAIWAWRGTEARRVEILSESRALRGTVKTEHGDVDVTLLAHTRGLWQVAGLPASERALTGTSPRAREAFSRSIAAHPALGGPPIIASLPPPTAW